MKIKLEPNSEPRAKAVEMFLSFLRIYGFKSLKDFCTKNKVSYYRINCQLRGINYLDVNYLNELIQLLNPTLEMKILDNGNLIKISNK
jgi:hypothetical protein